MRTPAEQEFDRTMRLMLFRMRSIARRYGPSYDAVDDIVQEASIRIWRHWETRRPATEEAWICTITRRIAIDFRRNANLRQFIAGVPLYSLDAFEEDIHLVADPSPSCDPLRLLLGAEQSGRAYDAVQDLHPTYREVLILLADGMSYIDAAARIGCPIGTVRSRQFRARNLMRELLTNERT